MFLYWDNIRIVNEHKICGLNYSVEQSEAKHQDGSYSAGISLEKATSFISDADMMTKDIDSS